MNLKNYVPNVITIFNLLCGVLAIITLSNGRIDYATGFIWAALVLDYLDGMAARILNARSEIGGQLDSLADMVSFGVVPGFIMFFLINHTTVGTQWAAPQWVGYPIVALLGLVMTAFAAIRLAKFNLDDRPHDSFYGVPTPANTWLTLAFLQIVTQLPVDHWFGQFFHHPLVLVGLSFLLSWLYISEIRLFTLKFKGLSLKENFYQYFIITIGTVSVLLFQYLAIPFIVILYIILSFIKNNIKREV